MKHQITSTPIISVESQTVSGPRGLRLELSAKEIYPKDPGMGTPRLVWFKGDSMTFDCALDNVAELIGCTYEQAEWAYNWLNSQSERADAWLDYHHEIAERLVS